MRILRWSKSPQWLEEHTWPSHFENDTHDQPRRWDRHRCADTAEWAAMGGGYGFLERGFGAPT